jgi:hypothetical protein
MDETSLRAQLDLAVSDEPPLGHLVGNSVRAGRRLRRRRRATGAASLSAAAIVVVSVVPALTAGADHRASSSHPATTRQPPETGTAYISLNNQNKVIPVSLATDTAGTPITAPAPVDDPFVTSAAATPDGRTVYEVGGNPGNGGTTVTPIDTSTNTARPAINLGAIEPQDFLVAPNGNSAYLSSPEGLYRIDTATKTASKVTDCTRYGCGAMAVTPDGKTLYVIGMNALGKPGTVTAVQTASNTVLTTITVPVPPGGHSFPFKIAVTPDGKTVYVADETFNGKPGASFIVPINVATNTPLAPIRLQAAGETDGIVIARDGHTAYVLSTRDVKPYQAEITPIDTATNKAEPAINLSKSAKRREWAGESYDRMAITPDGKTLYVLNQLGVVPVSTASGAVLPMINVPRLCTDGTAFAMTPEGRTIYVGACIWGTGKNSKIVGGGVVPISTATNTAGRFITLGQEPMAITFAG